MAVPQVDAFFLLPLLGSCWIVTASILPDLLLTYIVPLMLSIGAGAGSVLSSDRISTFISCGFLNSGFSMISTSSRVLHKSVPSVGFAGEGDCDISGSHTEGDSSTAFAGFGGSGC